MKIKIKMFLPRMRFNALPEQTRFCPDESSVSALLDNQAGQGKKQQMLTHISSCGYCQARLGALSQQNRLPDPEPNEELLAKAKQLAARQTGSWFAWTATRMDPRFVAAAVLVISFGIYLSKDAWQFTHPTVQSDETRQLRTLDVRSESLQLIKPADGSEVQPGMLVVEWLPIQGSLKYELSLMNEFGDLLLQRNVTGNGVDLGSEPMLTAGRKYFIRVAASLEDGRTLESSHIGFRISDTSGHGD